MAIILVAHHFSPSVVPAVLYYDYLCPTCGVFSIVNVQTKNYNKSGMTIFRVIVACHFKKEIFDN